MTIETKLGQIRKLLATADHPNTPPHEADTARNMAEALMVKYRIDAATAAAKGEGGDIIPQWLEMFLCNTYSEYAYVYRALASYVVDHVGCRMMVSNVQADDGKTWNYVAQVVGYESDLEIVDMLYTSFMLAFQQKLEPKYDASLSDQVNAYVMRSAGMEARRIAQAIYGTDAKKSDAPKVRKLFKREAEARGEDPTVLLGQGNSMKNYREAYAQGFASGTYGRLQTMRLSRGEDGGGLVLLGRNDAINEAFWNRYPNMRPAAPGKIQTTRTVANDGCEKCAKAKSGYCREHSWMKPKAYRVSRTQFNDKGYAAGGAAARTVDLGRGGTPKANAADKMGEL